MDAYGEAYYAQYYNPTPLFTSTDDELWDQHQPFLGDYSNQIAAPTMERYLHEPERSLFAHRPVVDHGTSYTYMSQEAGPWNHYYPPATQHTYPAIQRSYSPSNSGAASSYISSSYSDRRSTPASSPSPSVYCRSPEVIDNVSPFPNGSQPFSSLQRCDTGGSCVAMHDVQLYADAQPEIETFEDDHNVFYASYGIHEGYQPMQDNGEQDVDEDVPQFEDAATNEEIHPSDLPHFRHRRPQPKRPSTSSSRTTSRITKRGKDKKRSKSMNDKTNGHHEFNNNRAFPCPFTIYGCTSTFGSKNEWKRHINTQHMRLGYWRCDLCDQAERKPNDFNRKDLFIQHIRRMHPMEKTKGVKTKSGNGRGVRSDPEEQALVEAARRCWRQTRSPPAETGCLFCEVKFNGSGTWDERLEHIGRHMESSKKEKEGASDPENWLEDEAMEEWLAHEKIIVPASDGYTLAA